jgi:small subunit ribosomal protein S19
MDGFKKRRVAFIDGALFDKIRKVRNGTVSTQEIKTTSRSSVVYPEMVGLTISVHNGKAYIPLLITEQMLGYKLGEFVKTRVFTSHGGDKNAARAAAAKKGGKK